jgi:hypothetical protein
MDDTAMHDGIVRNGYLIANECARLLVGAMDYRTILNIGIVSNTDLNYIASNHGIEPHGAVFSHFHIPDHGSIGCQPAVISHFWSKSIYL